MNPTKHLDTLTSIWAERQDLDEREFHAVKRARLAGASWTEIGDSAGVSKQAVHERYTRLGIR